MEIKIITFAYITEICGFKEMVISIPEKSSVDDTLKILLKRFDKLKDMRSKLLYAVNDNYCKENKILNDNDILAIFPPVSGG